MYRLDKVFTNVVPGVLHSTTLYKNGIPCLTKETLETKKRKKNAKKNMRISHGEIHDRHKNIIL